MQRKIFSWRFKVRSYEIDQYGHVNNANYINYLEETALRASASVGFSTEWFDANQCLWVIRKMMVRYHEPAIYGDELEARSWVSDFRRVQSHREYEIVRVRDGVRVLRARANWVFIDREDLRPKRLLPEFYEAYQPSEEPMENIGTRIKNPDIYEDAHRFISYRTVNRTEIDRVGHVNNAHYFRWVEEAYFKALNSVGWDDRRLQEEKFIILAGSHEMEYKREAKEGDPIKIVSWAPELSRVRGSWIHEIRHAETDELIAKDYSMGIFLHVNEDNVRPGPLPEALRQGIHLGEQT